MEYSKYRFNLDMQSYISQVSLPVRQYDTGIVLRINLTDGGVPYIIKDGCRAVFCARKADGNPLMNDCVIEKNTTICYELTQQTTSCSGVVDCEVRVYGADGNLITTPRFILVIDSRVVHDEDFPLSQSEQTVLDNIIISETKRGENEAEREETHKRMKVTVEEASQLAAILRQKLDTGDYDGLTPYIGANGNWWIGEEDTGVLASGYTIPLRAGQGTHSLEHQDEAKSNKAVTENSIALGEGNVAGAKGYYFTEIFCGDTSTYPQIRISSVQPDEAGLYISSSEVLIPNKLFNAPEYVSLDKVNENKEDEYTEPDIFSLICNDHFALLGRIRSIDHDVITFDDLHTRDEYPTWVQPGTDDTGYAKNALVTYNGIPYKSTVASNKKVPSTLNGWSVYWQNIEDFKTRLALQVSYEHAEWRSNKTVYFNLEPNYDDYTLCVPSKPLVGVVEVCKNALSSGHGNISAGEEGTALGAGTKVVGAYGHASGKNTLAGYAAFASGSGTKATAKYSAALNDNTEASGQSAIAFNISTKAKGKASVAGGDRTEADAEDAVAFGKQTIASALAAFAEGLGYGGWRNEGTGVEYNWGPSEASDVGCHVEGIGTKASKEGAHAENFGTVASGKASHSGGLGSIASGYAAFIHAMFGLASGNYSAAFNYYTIASGFAQFVVGMYNKENPDALFIVGNGTSDTDRSNAFEVLKNGHIKLSEAQYGTEDLVAGESELPTGVLYFVYE